MIQVWGIVSFAVLWLFIAGCIWLLFRAIRRLERGVAEHRMRQGL